MSEFENILQFLNAKAEGQSSILEHTAIVYTKLVDFGLDRPRDFYEPFSYIIKEETSQETRLKLPEEDKLKISTSQFRQNAQLFSKQSIHAEGDEEEEQKEQDEEEQQPEPNDGEAPNVIEMMRFLSVFGLNLQEDEALLLQLSIAKLVKTKPLEKATFWGKIQHQRGYYYVVIAEFKEGEKPSGEEEEKTEEEETYFVTSSLVEHWTLLPDAFPNHIVLSRSVDKILTGDLNAQVDEKFKGTEGHLVRAIIARIHHSTGIAPRGLYLPEEEPTEEEEQLDSNAPINQVEEFVYKPLKDLTSFVHRIPALLSIGKTTLPETEEEDHPSKKPKEKGPPILRTLAEDEPNGDIPSWTLKESNSFFWLRSNFWPGVNFVSTSTGDRIVFIYYGWGTKATEPVPFPEVKVVKKKKSVEEEEEDKVEKEKVEKKPVEEEDTIDLSNDAPPVGQQDDSATYSTED